MVRERNTVFEETYHHYLSEIGRIDFLAKAELLAVGRERDSLIIPFYDTTYTVSPAGVYDVQGRRTDPAVQVILSKYVLICEAFAVSEPDRLKTYRDFQGSGPLHSYFTATTTTRIAEHFTGRLELLRERASGLGGVEKQADSYDFSALFYALPRIPVLLNYNERDELFPAACSVLYRESAAQFLDMECLAMTGALLAQKLTGAGEKRDQVRQEV